MARRPWPPEGGSASLEVMSGGVHDGIGALPDGIGLCPLATVPSRAGNGGTGSPPVQGHRQRSLFRREVPYSVVHPAAHGLQRGRATLRRPPAARRAFVKLARCPRTGGRGTVELARRPCGCIVRILRRLPDPPGGRRWPSEGGSRPPVASGGWLGLSGSHRRRGARQNRGVARRNRALPARDRARKGWARWRLGEPS